MAHPRARLTVFGRQILVARVAAGWPAVHVAEQLGISRATAYKWVRRHRAEGEAGLLDRSSRPHRSPRQLSPAIEAEILAARASWRYGPDRLGPLLGRPPSSVHRVLARHGLSRLRDADRVTTAPIRYVACHPGALLHQDHKKLGRIPDGGGWRALGRGGGTKRGHSRIGYDHLEVVIDDTSRYAVVVPVPDESGASAWQPSRPLVYRSVGLSADCGPRIASICAAVARPSAAITWLYVFSVRLIWPWPNDHYERKLAEHKSSRAALRSLRRQLAKVVYRQLVADRAHDLALAV